MRDVHLQPLTHDHHHALAAARRLRLAADGPDEDSRAESVAKFLDFFNSAALRHFREEEERLLPLVIHEAEAEGSIQRTLLEHVKIHAAIQAMSGSRTAGSMRAVARLFEEHIRFEEKVLFPMIESMVGSDGLGGLSLEPRSRGIPVS